MRQALLLASLSFAAPTAAEVRSSSSNGFELEQRLETRVPPTDLFNAFGRIDRWWNPEHSYSGTAANLSLTMAPGGCFCERLSNGGGVEHLRVSFIDPGKQIVLTGALGPLLYQAVNGVMTVKVEPAPGGSRLTMNYRASGFANGGADKMTPLVDGVLAEQVRRLGTYVGSGDQRNRP